jgi:hypothetical protein
MTLISRVFFFTYLGPAEAPLDAKLRLARLAALQAIRTSTSASAPPNVTHLL